MSTILERLQERFPDRKGGNGTTYDANHVNSEYARIDTEETPGYFTAASA